ncbi:MAG: hypothetical protein K1X88_07075 [Nannocystaceae bacterium]|nr:hypothetical protein [Nannocystaceae bacterium]
MTRTWVLALCVLAACRGGGRELHSPAAVRAAYLDALAKDDPKAAYALLAPQLRRRVPYESFAARWRADAAERAAIVEAARASSKGRDRVAVARRATTVHEGGVVLHWAKIGKQWYVVDGLPGDPRASTPAEAIRGFLAAIARAELGGAQRYLSDELAGRMREDFAARVDAIEAALEVPGAIELSDDLSRAQLRYEPQRVLTLEQTPRGWTITGLE